MKIRLFNMSDICPLKAGGGLFQFAMDSSVLQVEHDAQTETQEHSICFGTSAMQPALELKSPVVLLLSCHPRRNFASVE